MAKKKEIEAEEEESEEEVSEDEVSEEPSEEVEETEEAAESEEKPESRTDDREMFKIKCSECGKDAEVPFKPSSDRPVYCRECFMKHRKPRRSFGGGRSFGRRF